MDERKPSMGSITLLANTFAIFIKNLVFLEVNSLNSENYAESCFSIPLHVKDY